MANPLEIREREPLLGTSAAVRIRPAKVPAVSLLEAMREPLYRRAVFAVMAVMIAFFSPDTDFPFAVATAASDLPDWSWLRS